MIGLIILRVVGWVACRSLQYLLVCLVGWVVWILLLAAWGLTEPTELPDRVRDEPPAGPPRWWWYGGPAGSSGGAGPRASPYPPDGGDDPMAVPTRRRLVDGALDAIRRHGIAATSARAIAAAAGVNQALIFYHFGSVSGLLAEACRLATEERIERYRDLLDAVTSFDQLLDLGRLLHAEERELGNVAILAQLLAGAQRDASLAPVVASAMRLWTAEIETVLSRLLAGSPFADVIDIPGLATATSAVFVGIELVEGVDAVAATGALDALQRLAILIEVADQLGPVARRVLRRRLATPGGGATRAAARRSGS